ncbi:MAG TPA: hypothetical protein VN408_06720 [Actinoplanes sp.]|nr:hypothetical protein [Actinoplanes sp.]
MRFAAGAVLGVLLGALLGVPAAAATSKVPAVVTTLTAPKAMAAAGGKLFVSEGNTVVVLGTDGRTTKTISGLFGAAGIVANGDRVYVALSQAAAIAVLDPATLTEIGRWTTVACPVNLAFAGTRLFYGHGCPTNGTPGLGSVDATTGTGAQTVPGSFYSAPLVAGAGSTLAVGVPGLSPATVSTYRVDGTTVTPLATAEVGSYLGGVTVSKDGTKVATAAGSPYHLAQFTAKTMAGAGTFETGAYPATVAYSPDGTKLGGGVDAHGAGNVRAFHVATGLSLLDGNAHPKPAYNQPGPVTGTLTWAADGSRLYTLLDELTSAAPGLLAELGPAGGFPHVTGELLTNTVELVSAPHRRVREAVTDLTRLAEQIATLDCAAEIDGLRDIVSRGASYQRQLRTAAANNGSLKAVVSSLVREMREDSF